MSKRNNHLGGTDTGTQVESKRSGGKVLLALIVVVGVIYVLHTTSAYLQKFVAVAAGGDVTVGTWAVGAVLAVFLGWCFLSGSKGGRR